MFLRLLGSLLFPSASRSRPKFLYIFDAKLLAGIFLHLSFQSFFTLNILCTNQVFTIAPVIGAETGCDWSSLVVYDWVVIVFILVYSVIAARSNNFFKLFFLC